MPATRIPIDGLWRCLCPAFDSLAITQASRGRINPSIRHNVQRSSRARRFHSTPARWNLSTVIPPRVEAFDQELPDQTQYPTSLPEGSQTYNPIPARSQDYTRDADSLLHSHERPSDVGSNPTKHRTPTRRGIPLEEFPGVESVEDVPLEDLHERLRLITNKEHTFFRITALVEYLILERGETPALIHYDALIRANADALSGSAAVVEHLLREMKEENIKPDSGTYHAVLQVLAIHPDYLLQNQILQEMKERWMGLSPDGWHNLVVGLLRHRQFELAMDRVEQMHADEIKVQPWLYDILLYQLCETGELDEAFRILHYRFEHNSKQISYDIWYYLLDQFSANFHYAGTKFIWKARIETSDMVPSDGLCVSVLDLAAREGDSQLARSAVHKLSQRASVLSVFHYEALLTAYTKAGDLQTAFRVLSIMSKAGLEPDPSTTRPLFQLLITQNWFPQKAWKVLKELHEDGHILPVAAANVVIEAQIRLRRLDQAIEFYKTLHEVIEGGPNTETFNYLLQGTRAQNLPASAEGDADDPKAIAMFLASEMRALRINADQLTYDRFILACLETGDYEDSFRYLEEMVAVGAEKGAKWWMRKGTAKSVVKKCVEARDERAWTILGEMEERGMSNVEDTRMWAQTEWLKSDVEG